MKKLFTITLLLGGILQGYSQNKTTATTPPALSAIKDADLKKDIFELAGDAFRGRRAGSEDEMRAAAWVAQKAQEAGLKPAGDDGTYFQYFNMKRTRTADRSTLQLGSQSFKMGKDFWVTQPKDFHLDAPVVWLNSITDTTSDIKGKIVALKIQAPTTLPAAGMSLWEFRYTSSAIRQYGSILRGKGVAAIIFVANEVTEKGIAFIGHNYEDGSYQNDKLGTRFTKDMIVHTAPIILLRAGLESAFKQGGNLQADVIMETYLYPSVNVVAKATGSDAKLRDEYVLYSGHHDHDGIGNPVNQDSIWNGADDNASVTVGMLAIGRAWVAKPGKRSALFVWHGAEERGLLGSRWYAVHPTVKKESIVAVLNGDMIGRNSIDSAALLGTLLPHRNSTALVDMAMKANTDLTKFKHIDTSWDDARHPENWYFRSDHAPYAQAGIPAIFFTSLLHPDYHTPKDEPDRISIPKLAKMTRWMYATGWLVSQTAARPALDAK